MKRLYSIFSLLIFAGCNMSPHANEGTMRTGVAKISDNECAAISLIEIHYIWYDNSGKEIGREFRGFRLKDAVKIECP